MQLLTSGALATELPASPDATQRLPGRRPTTLGYACSARSAGQYCSRPKEINAAPREKWRAAPTAAYTSDAALKSASLHTTAVIGDAVSAARLWTKQRWGALFRGCREFRRKIKGVEGTGSQHHQCSGRR